MTRTFSLSEQSGIRGLVSSKQNFVDCFKPEICETVDIHSEVPRHVETVCLLFHQQVKKSVTIDYMPDGSYMKNVNRHATYKEINEYVEAKYGF